MAYNPDNDGPIDDDCLMRPDATSSYLKDEFNIDHTPATLATKRVRGGGPEFFKAGMAILYRKSRVNAWARAFLGEPATSTAALRAMRQPPRAAADQSEHV